MRGPVDEILWRNPSNETSSAVLSHGTIYLVQMYVLTFESVDEILSCDQSIETSLTILSRGTIYQCLALTLESGRKRSV